MTADAIATPRQCAAQTNRYRMNTVAIKTPIIAKSKTLARNQRARMDSRRKATRQASPSADSASCAAVASPALCDRTMQTFSIREFCKMAQSGGRGFGIIGLGSIAEFHAKAIQA